MVEFAYKDAALSIEADQTISQPYMVALMTAALKLDPAGRPHTGDRHRILVESARERFKTLGYDNIETMQGDGTLG